LRRPLDYSDLYVALLSEKEDDFSQWRAYGGKHGEHGYSIGFDTAFLKPKYATVSNLFLGKVSYNHDFNRQICQRLLDVIFKFSKSEGNLVTEGKAMNHLDVYKFVVYRYLEAHAFKWFPLMKDKSFRDEAEWRIVYQKNHNDASNQKFRAHESMISRHIPQTYLRPDGNIMHLRIHVILV